MSAHENNVDSENKTTPTGDENDTNRPQQSTEKQSVPPEIAEINPERKTQYLEDEPHATPKSPSC